MPCESKSWRPAHWSVTKRRLFEDHVYRWCEHELNAFLGPYTGAQFAAAIRAQRRAKQSLELLHRIGVRTLGGVGS